MVSTGAISHQDHTQLCVVISAIPDGTMSHSIVMSVVNNMQEMLVDSYYICKFLIYFDSNSRLHRQQIVHHYCNTMS